MKAFVSCLSVLLLVSGNTPPVQAPQTEINLPTWSNPWMGGYTIIRSVTPLTDRQASRGVRECRMPRAQPR